jgi:hypothetical protein
MHRVRPKVMSLCEYQLFVRNRLASSTPLPRIILYAIEVLAVRHLAMTAT